MATELAPLTQSAPPGPQQDAFGDTASKLVALLDLPEHPRVLLIGGGASGQLGRLAGGFPDREVHRSIHALARTNTLAGKPFDLVLWHLDPVREHAAFEAGMARVRDLLAPGGSLLLLAPNRLALRRLRRNPGQLLRRGPRTRSGYRAAAGRAGFTTVEEYLPIPGMHHPEEFVASSRPLDIPAHLSSVIHRLGRVGLLAGLHEGFLYHLAIDGGGTARLLDRIAVMLLDGTARRPNLCLDRYSLRGRGALILSLVEPSTGRSLIVRITTCDLVDRVVRRNTEWTRWLHASPSLDESARALIPAAIGSVAIGSLSAHAEEKVPGIIAWKIAVGGADSALFDSACAFLRSLAQATVEPVRFDSEVLERDLALPDHGWYDADFLVLLAAYRERLIALMSGRQRTYCLSHGDYGYGNLLAQREPARVSGVIDWDQARMDLAGIDLVNFLVQRYRMRNRVPLKEALSAIWADLPAGESGTVVRAVYPEVPGMREPERRAELFAWLLWRFVERDTRYQTEYDRGRDHLADCLRWALEEILP